MSFNIANSNKRLIVYEKDEKKQFAIAGLITAYYYQLNDLLEDYYDYLEVEEKEIMIEKRKS